MIYKTLKNKLIFLLPIPVLLLFIYSIWDSNFYFGGDLMYPINAKITIFRSLFLWDEQNGGQSFFGYATLLWEGFFYIMQTLLIPPNYAEKILIITMFVLGFIFTFLSYRLLFKGTKYSNKSLGIFAAFMFTVSPAVILMPGAYPPLFAFPVCYYFLIKFLDSHKLYFLIPFSLFLNFHFFTDFPQPKLLAVFSMSIIFLVLIYSYVRGKKILIQYLKLIPVVIICILINFYVFFPFVFDMFGKSGYFGYLSQPGYSYNGMADLYSAIIPYISRFYNSNLVNNTTKIGMFLSNPLFIAWTYLLWGFILGGALLVKEKKDRIIIYLLLISTAFFIFIAKGPNPPFDRIYKYLLLTVPAFKIFRTTATVIFGGLFFYVSLLGMAVYQLRLRLRSFLGIILLVHLIIFLPILMGYQFYRLDQNSKGVTMPSEYYDLGSLLNKTGQDNKVLTLPLNNGYVAKTWAYTGSPIVSWLTEKPVIHNYTFLKNNFNADVDNYSDEVSCYLTKLYNIGYLLWEKDSLHVPVAKDFNMNGKTVFRNQYFDLKKIDNNCILPKIYLTDYATLYKGGMENLYPSLRYGKTLQFPLIIQDEKYPQDKNINSVIVNSEPDKQFIFPSGRVTVNFSLGRDGLINDVTYPYVRFKPDSIFYPLVLRKEKLEERGVYFNKNQLLDKKLSFASKRIGETVLWGVNNNWWDKNLELYKSIIIDAINSSLNSENKNSNLELIAEYLDYHEQKIIEASKNNAYWNKEKKDIWLESIGNLRKKIKSKYQVPDFSSFNYPFSVPVAGKYHINIDNLSSTSKTSIYLNSKKINNDIGTVSESYYLKPGNNNMHIVVNNYQNLINQNKWQQIEFETKPEVSIDNDSIKFNDKNNLKVQAPERVKAIYQQIDNWNKNKFYGLRIAYRNKESAALKLLVLENREIYVQDMEKWISKDVLIDSKTLDQPDDEFKSLIKPDKNGRNIKIILYSENGNSEIKLVELHEIGIPRVFLNSELDTIRMPDNILQNITSEKINPTSYKISIKNRENPFYLVFSENFNPGWKAYISNQQKGKMVEIPEKNHLIGNGYANVWYITSDRITKDNAAVIKLEYAPQKNMYIGAVISIIAIIACFMPFYEIFRPKK